VQQGQENKKIDFTYVCNKWKLREYGIQIGQENVLKITQFNIIPSTFINFSDLRVI
jgi:hypothetical protein